MTRSHGAPRTTGPVRRKRAGAPGPRGTAAVYRADPNEVRAELLAVLAQARAAQSLPWTRGVRSIAHRLSADDKLAAGRRGRQLRFEFETEIGGWSGLAPSTPLFLFSRLSVPTGRVTDAGNDCQSARRCDSAQELTRSHRQRSGTYDADRRRTMRRMTSWRLQLRRIAAAVFGSSPTVAAGSRGAGSRRTRAAAAHLLKRRSQVSTSPLLRRPRRGNRPSLSGSPHCRPRRRAAAPTNADRCSQPA